MSTLIVAELAVQLVTALCPLRPRIKRHGRSLHEQLVAASESVALNIGEAELSDPGNQRARFATAAGSANETLMALRVAKAWGYIRAEEAVEAEALLRRIIPMLVKLSRR